MTSVTNKFQVDLELQRARLIVAVTEQVSGLMKAEAVSKSELARRLQKSPAFVTKLMSGTNNFTVATVADVCSVLGYEVNLSTTLLRQEAGELTAERRCHLQTFMRSINSDHQGVDKAVLIQAANSNYALAA